MRSPLSSGDKILTKKKSRRSAVHPLAKTPITPKNTCEVASIENSPHNMSPSCHRELAREHTYSADTPPDVHHTKRTSNRTRTNGIVALTNFAKPVVTKIYDIAPGGVSFLHSSEIDSTESALQMDILIFDNLTNFEYLINEIKGCVKSKNLVEEPKSKKPIWRYSVAFIDLDSEKQQRLKILFNRVPPANDQISYARYLKASYDS